MAQEDFSGLLFAADVFGYELNPTTGVPSNNPIFFKATVGLKPNLSSEKVQRRARNLRDAGQVVGERLRANPTEFTLDVNALSIKTATQIFGGSIETLTETGGTIASQALTVVLNEWHYVGKRNISAVTVDGTPDVAITGENVQSELGLIFISSGINITAGANTINFTHGAVAGSRIAAGVRAVTNFKIEAAMTNEEDNTKWRLVIPKIGFATNGTLDFLGDDYTNASLTGTAVKLATETGSYYLDQLTYS